MCASISAAFLYCLLHVCTQTKHKLTYKSREGVAQSQERGSAAAEQEMTSGRVLFQTKKWSISMYICQVMCQYVPVYENAACVDHQRVVIADWLMAQHKQTQEHQRHALHHSSVLAHTWQ